MARFVKQFVLLSLMIASANMVLALAPIHERRASFSADGSGSDMEVGYESAPPVAGVAVSATDIALRESRRAVPFGEHVPDVRIYIPSAGCEYTVPNFIGDQAKLYAAYARFVARAQRLQNEAEWAATSHAASTLVPAPAPVLERSFSTATTVRPPSPNWLESMPAALHEVFADGAAGSSASGSRKRRASKIRRAAEIADSESKVFEVSESKVPEVLASKPRSRRPRPVIENVTWAQLHAPGFNDFSSSDEEDRRHYSRLSS